MIGRIFHVRTRLILAVVQWPLWLVGVYVALFDQRIESAPFVAAAGTASILYYIDRHVAPVTRAYRNGYRAGFEDAVETCAECRSTVSMPDPVYPAVAVSGDVLSLRRGQQGLQ